MNIAKNTIQYVVLIIIGILMIGPLLWLVSTAFKSNQENIFLYPPQLLPASPTFNNFVIYLTVS
jgi:putative chitobiose transport system permease protein